MNRPSTSTSTVGGRRERLPVMLRRPSRPRPEPVAAQAHVYVDRDIALELVKAGTKPRSARRLYVEPEVRIDQVTSLDAGETSYIAKPVVEEALPPTQCEGSGTPVGQSGPCVSGSSEEMPATVQAPAPLTLTITSLLPINKAEELFEVLANTNIIPIIVVTGAPPSDDPSAMRTTATATAPTGIVIDYTRKYISLQRTLSPVLTFFIQAYIPRLPSRCQRQPGTGLHSHSVWAPLPSAGSASRSLPPCPPHQNQQARCTTLLPKMRGVRPTCGQVSPLSPRIA